MIRGKMLCRHAQVTVLNLFIKPIRDLARLCINAYCTAGMPHHQYPEQLRAEGMFISWNQSLRLPLVDAIIEILQTCIHDRSPFLVNHLHLQLIQSGLDLHAELGNHLILLFAKCESHNQAQQTYQKLGGINSHSCTYFIESSINIGNHKVALEVLWTMQQQCLMPDRYASRLLVKACRHLKCLHLGMEMHKVITLLGFNRDQFLGPVLVSMYAKCGSLAEAHMVLNNLIYQDVVVWSALIAGYAEYGYGKEVLYCLKQMKSDGIVPNEVTIICALKNCSDVTSGRELHFEVAKEGFENDLFVGSALVDMYAKCGLFLDAHEIFEEIPDRDVVTWTAIIGGYAEHSYGEEALAFLDQMEADGIAPNAVTFFYGLKSCACIQDKGKGQKLHASIFGQGFEHDCLVGSGLVEMYACCDCLVEAKQVLEGLPHRDGAGWSALIVGYSKNNQHEEAFQCLKKMKFEGLSPDEVTYACILRSCRRTKSVERGQEIHMYVMKDGLESDYSICISLVGMYAKCGWLLEAREVFDEMLVQDVVAWNVLITGYSELALGSEVLECLDRMWVEGVIWDDVTLASCLTVVGEIAAINRGQALHIQCVKQGYDNDVFVSISLLNMYSKCSLLEESLKIFDRLPTMNLVSWSALIAGYANCGESETVFRLFDRMTSEGQKPDMITFVSILNACSHGGLVDLGLQYFHMMSQQCEIIPSLEHLNCMVDLLSRAGQLEITKPVVEMMPFQPGFRTWSMLLSACQKHGDVNFAQYAFECADKDDDHVLYVLMSNVFADARIWQHENYSKEGLHNI